MSHYYVDNHGQKEGPHDLVTIMRRIRAKKIRKDTLVYAGDNTPALPAAQIAEIKHFFDSAEVLEAQEEAPLPGLGELIRDGWQFLIQNHIISVYSGGMLLLTVMLASGLINSFGYIAGGMLAWVIFVFFHNLYFVFMLRMQRGQSLGSDFINHKLGPVLLTFTLTNITLALMMAGGLFLLVIPGIIVSVMYIFAPFLIMDKRYGMAEAMYASRLLLQKRGRRYVGLVSTLVFLHLLCLVLIIPIPLTLPIFASALCSIYEEMLAA